MSQQDIYQQLQRHRVIAFGGGLHLFLAHSTLLPHGICIGDALINKILSKFEERAAPAAGHSHFHPTQCNPRIMLYSYQHPVPLNQVANSSNAATPVYGHRNVGASLKASRFESSMAFTQDGFPTTTTKSCKPHENIQVHDK
jgi:hypothetical protein